MSASPRSTRIPALVVVVCLPLIVSKAILYFALGLETIDPRASALIGFAGTLAYLAVFLPAALLFEPFAIIASVWYTKQRLAGDPLGRLFVCWAAVIVHTTVLISYLRLGR